MFSVPDNSKQYFTSVGQPQSNNEQVQKGGGGIVPTLLPRSSSQQMNRPKVYYFLQWSCLWLLPIEIDKYFTKFKYDISCWGNIQLNVANKDNDPVSLEQLRVNNGFILYDSYKTDWTYNSV